MALGDLGFSVWGWSFVFWSGVGLIEGFRDVGS